MPKKVPTKQVPKVVPQSVPQQEKKAITDNCLVNLIGQTCMKIL
jgi:hypothetical protein